MKHPLDTYLTLFDHNFDRPQRHRCNDHCCCTQCNKCSCSRSKRSEKRPCHADDAVRRKPTIQLYDAILSAVLAAESLLVLHHCWQLGRRIITVIFSGINEKNIRKKHGSCSLVPSTSPPRLLLGAATPLASSLCIHHAALLVGHGLCMQWKSKGLRTEHDGEQETLSTDHAVVLMRT